MKNFEVKCPKCKSKFYRTLWIKGIIPKGNCPNCNIKESIKKFIPIQKKRKYGVQKI